MTKLFSKNVARSTDLIFLKSLVGPNQTNGSCCQSQSKHPDEPPTNMPVSHDSMRLIEQAKTICEQRIYLDEAKELYSLISSKWLHAVLEIHDEVAAQIQNSTEEVEYIDGVSSVGDELDDDDEVASISTVNDEKGVENENEELQIDTFRVIGVRRHKGECLGLTVRLEDGKLIVARVLIDSIIHRQGLVRPGDSIIQVNGKDVKDPEKLQQAIEESGEFIVFKIQPTISLDFEQFKSSTMKEQKSSHESEFFVRALFDYQAQNDNLLPCQDIGLSFNHGDILEIVNYSDPSWWQARKVNSNERPGLIPSQDLEERRQSFFVRSNKFNQQVSCCGTPGKIRREKNKHIYMVRNNLDFDKAELLLYEPVEKVAPFIRKTLVLVSPPDIPKQAIIHKLIDSNKDIFGTAIPLTSRPIGAYELDGDSYWFVSASKMEELDSANEFLDMRQHDGYQFGIKFQSVKDIIHKENKLCILDCRPEALKFLHHSTEFLPFVIYLCSKKSVENEKKVNDEDDCEEIIQDDGKHSNVEIKMSILSTCNHPSDETDPIFKEYQKYYDLEIAFEDVDSAYNEVKKALDKLTSEVQWIPRNWVYS